MKQYWHAGTTEQPERGSDVMLNQRDEATH
jgi:hypothetical protein